MMKRALLSLAVLLAVSALCVTSSAGQGNGSMREGAEHAVATAATQSATTGTLKLIEATLDSRLTLKSVYFPTALPLLVPSQQRRVAQLARDFKRYRSLRPDAHLVLEARTDPRGGVLYNHALAQRRADRVKDFRWNKASMAWPFRSKYHRTCGIRRKARTITATAAALISCWVPPANVRLSSRTGNLWAQPKFFLYLLFFSRWSVSGSSMESRENRVRAPW